MHTVWLPTTRGIQLTRYRSKGAFTGCALQMLHCVWQEWSNWEPQLLVPFRV